MRFQRDRGSYGGGGRSFGGGGRRFDRGGSDREQDNTPKPINEGEEYDVEITEVGSRGDGIARIKNFVVFVANGKKGEKCKIKIKEVRYKFATADKVGEASESTEAGEETEKSEEKSEESAAETTEEAEEESEKESTEETEETEE